MRSLPAPGILLLTTLTAFSTFASTTAGAQQSQPAETMPSRQDSNSSGSAPPGMGSTGWTGGSGGSHIGKDNPSTAGSAADTAPGDAADQPEMATGLDLKGPPMRFPANNTPE